MIRVAVVAASGLLVVKEERDGRTWRAEIPPDGSLSVAEVAELCGVHRSTVYRWAVEGSGWSYGPPPLRIDDGRIELPELRRYLRQQGTWWLRERPAAEMVARHGPEAPNPSDRAP